MDLFTNPDAVPVGPATVPQKRPKGTGAPLDKPECYEILPGWWVVAYYDLSPKQGWPENWEFPIFWGFGSWHASVDGTVPDGVIVWASRRDAEHDLGHNHPPGRPFRVGCVTWPSTDQRRRPPSPRKELITMHPAFETADKIAPEPATANDATTQAWIRHYLAQAMAAHVEFRTAIAALPTLAAAARRKAGDPDAPPSPKPGSRPELGYLMHVAVGYTAAAAALVFADDPAIGNILWHLTPEAGALNGEYVHWLANTLDKYGINPADIDDAFDPTHFKSPPATVEPVDTPGT